MEGEKDRERKDQFTGREGKMSNKKGGTRKSEKDGSGTREKGQERESKICTSFKSMKEEVGKYMK